MKLEIGDVYELRTKRGLVYVRCTHFAERKDSAAVMRLLEGFHQERPESFRSEAVFAYLHPRNSKIHDEFLVKVAHAEVPATDRAFPTFRNGEPHPEDGKVRVWWLWDGKDSRRVDGISALERQYPFREIWSYPVLIEKIETGWTPATDPRN